jgi:hypothetical protein
VPQEITGLMHGGSMRQQLWGARCLSQVETLPLDPQMMCRLLLKQHAFASNILLQTILLIESEVLFYPKSFLYDGLGGGAVSCPSRLCLCGDWSQGKTLTCLSVNFANQILHLGKMMWSGIVEAGPSTPTQGGMPKSVRRQRLPACKGHSMVRQKKTFFIVKIGHFDEQTKMVEWLKSEKAYFRWTERSRSHALLKFRAGFWELKMTCLLQPFF